MTDVDHSDMDHHIEATHREVETRDRAGEEVKVIRMSRRYDVPLAELWEACTTAERLSRWIAPVSGELRLGGRYQIEGNATGVVEECLPRERIAVTWEYAGETSWVVAAFAEERGGARLVVEHIAPRSPHWEEFGAGAGGIGWDLMLLGLGLHLRDTAFRGDPAWLGTPEGRELMARSGERWRRAQIAGEGDEAAANAAAERCRRAYLGD